MQKFITISGMEGTGKTTIIKKLLNADKNSVAIKEPHNYFREFLCTNRYDTDPNTEMLTFSAARSFNLNNIVIPSINKRKNVYADRWYPETWVYQGFCKNANRGLSEAIYENMFSSIKNGHIYKPTHTFLLITDPKLSLSRSYKENAKNNSNESAFEDLGLKFHKKVKEGFKRYCGKGHANNCLLIDTSNMTLMDTYEFIKRSIK